MECRRSKKRIIKCIRCKGIFKQYGLERTCPVCSVSFPPSRLKDKTNVELISYLQAARKVIRRLSKKEAWGIEEIVKNKYLKRRNRQLEDKINVYKKYYSSRLSATVFKGSGRASKIF